MLVFVKFGGSLITDKTQEGVFLEARMARLAEALAAVRAAQVDLRLLLGHGSGSFGHFEAQKYGTAQGVYTRDEWIGLAAVARVARQLNHLVTGSLAGAGLPVWSMQPSASAICDEGDIRQLATVPLQTALQHDLVPLVHGDVALDSVRGGTIISTETIFYYLAPILRPAHIFLLGEVEGVLDREAHVIPRITPSTLPAIDAALGSSHGVDVTGGMASKVRAMVRLVQANPGLCVHILSGLDADRVRMAIQEPASAPGTVITAT